jgi:hypothetical protein
MAAKSVPVGHALRARSWHIELRLAPMLPGQALATG